MDNIYYVTQKQKITINENMQTINAPDIFSESIKGDVYMLSLSLGLQDYLIDSETILKIELINSYHNNTGGAVGYLTLEPQDATSPLLLNLAPCEYTVLQNGINPLDNEMVHIDISIVSGNLTSATLVTRSVWQKVNWVNF